MPIIKTKDIIDISDSAVEKLLKNNGVIKSSAADKGLPSILEDHGLGPEDLVKELKYLLDSDESAHVKLRVIETGLKLNKALGEDEQKFSPINIIIKDGESVSINPILIPR